jgi:hypothetical protein
VSDVLVNLVAGLVGALVGGSMAWVIEVRRRRVEVTLGLFSEFNTPAMLNTRHAAAEQAEAYPDLDFAQLRQQVGRGGMQEIWAVEVFYRKLWLLMEHRQVQRAMVPALFGDRFAWWVRNHFAGRLFPLDTAQARDLRALWTWLEGAATPEQRRRWGEHT